MKHLIFLLLICQLAEAQHIEWRTGIRDTSYSNQSDYAHNIKAFPFIRLVPDSPVVSVREQRNLIYARDLHIDAFTVQYRLSTEAFYTAAVNDLKAALKWLHAHADSFHIDPDRISIPGFSAGGELAAFIGVTDSSGQVNSVIDIDGTLSFVHPESSETQHPETIGASAWWLGYPRTERLDLWTAASPLTYAAE